MDDREFELREVAHEPSQAGEPLQESAVGDAGTWVAAVSGVATLGYTVRAARAARRREAYHEAQLERAYLAAARAQMAAEQRVHRAELDAELRFLRAQLGFGPDDYYGGFGVDDDYYDGGFGVE